MNEFPSLYIILLLLAGLSGIVLFLGSSGMKTPTLRLLLSFGAAYLLGLTFLHLVPEIFSSGVDHAGWYILAGFVLQIVLDFFSHGVEHGHAHPQKDRGMTFLLPVIISLWIHAFIEGMPFGGSWGTATEGMHAHAHVHAHGMDDHRSSLIVGIGLHKVTESLVFCALLLGSGMEKRRALLWFLLFASMAPIGCAVQFMLGSSGAVDILTFTPKITAILVGIMLHVATTVLFESSEGHHFNLRKFLAIIAGLLASGVASYI